MSLDFYIESPPRRKPCCCRDCGDEHTTMESREHFSANITHNLGRMAGAAGIYDALWHPENLNITRAGDLIPLLKDGLQKLNADPDHYSTFNASNGWGLYIHFVPFVRSVLQGCQDYPDGIVRTST